MAILNWQTEHPIDAIIFDCDGTLSSIEGVDQLAKKKGIAETISAMTEDAMGKTGLNPDLYAKRLALIQPSKHEVNELSQDYFTHKTAFAKEIIELFQKLHKSIYILSAGLLPAVKTFGKQISVPEKNIFAVDITFDHLGNYKDFDRQSPLIFNDGKQYFARDINAKHKNIVYVGDGLNDLASKTFVNYFIGFGGFFYREIIKNQSDFYLTTPSLLPLLALCLTPAEISCLSHEDDVMVKRAQRML